MQILMIRHDFDEVANRWFGVCAYIHNSRKYQYSIYTDHPLNEERNRTRMEKALRFRVKKCVDKMNSNV